MAIDFNLIQTLTGVLGGSGIIGGGTYVYNKYRKRIIVKLVKDKKDPDIDDFILLYDIVIDENTRVAPDEIIKFIGCHKPTPDTTICDYLFFCKKESILIGFLKALYCHENKVLFIAYLGIDKQNEQGRKQATLKLYKKLRKLIKSKHKDCTAIVFEVETGNNASAKSLAKLRLFKNAVERFSFPCLRFNIGYFQPEMPSDRGSIPKEQTALLFVPIKKELRNQREIDKQSMLNYLNFIYLKLYGRFYEDKDLNTLYQNYLEDLLQKYQNELPEIIKLT